MRLMSFLRFRFTIQRKMLLRFACDCCASAFVCVCVCVRVRVCACTCVLHSFMCYCCCCCWFSCRFMAPVVEHQTKRPPLKSMLHFSHLSSLHRVYAAYSACQLYRSGKRIVFACLQLIACDSLLNFRFVEFLNVFNFKKVFFFWQRVFFKTFDYRGCSSHSFFSLHISL